VAAVKLELMRRVSHGASILVLDALGASDNAYSHGRMPCKVSARVGPGFSRLHSEWSPFGRLNPG
jgi:hypothetical protein